MLAIKRVYDPFDASDGTRLLVERLWPRGIKKTDLKLDAWLKDVAPSHQLRRWFNHDPAKWTEFRRRYFQELNAHPSGLDEILRAARRGRVTLIYSSRDTQHNNAAALKEYVDAALKRSGQRQTA
jgi:uncharacterized protein YeaO (DUF488 family)